MNPKSISNDNEKIRLEGCLILIVGPRKLQNELMASFLEREIGSECLAYERIGQLQDINQQSHKGPVLILADCLEKGLEDCLADFELLGNRLLSSHLVTLFNVTPGMGIEDHAIRTGVRGVFYVQDPLERFPKAIRAIIGGELWVSREIMSKCIIEGKDKGLLTKKDTTTLTSREIEILGMVASGAKNEEIAEKLFISPNTVKTHIYNIFKKIDVPNRLQAALWAAKNL